MKDHIKTIQDLDEKIREANKIKKDAHLILISIKSEIERAKALIDKLNADYGIERK